MFNWSEVHLYQSSFLQNQYFKGPSILLVKNIPNLLIFSWSYACLKMHLCRMAAAPVVLDHEGTNLKIWPKILPQNVEQCAAHASKLHIQLDFRCRNTMEQKSIWILTLALFFVTYFFDVFFLNFKDVNLKAFGTSFLYWKLILLQLQKDLVPFLASYRFRHTCRMQRYKIDSWKCEPFSIMWFIKDFSMYSKVGYCHSAVIIWGQKNMKLNFKI